MGCTLLVARFIPETKMCGHAKVRRTTLLYVIIVLTPELSIRVIKILLPVA